MSLSPDNVKESMFHARRGVPEPTLGLERMKHRFPLNLNRGFTGYGHSIFVALSVTLIIAPFVPPAKPFSFRSDHFSPSSCGLEPPESLRFGLLSELGAWTPRRDLSRCLPRSLSPADRSYDVSLPDADASSVNLVTGKHSSRLLPHFDATLLANRFDFGRFVRYVAIRARRQEIRDRKQLSAVCPASAPGTDWLARP